ncbi:ABC transporter permease [Metabacillus elymi]|uniref:ABC transporter permease n=1 Tax=Metabacillus elymi TaxID=2745198 RepID=A0ABX6S2Y9_9BACI|nr:ABC transporter permease [Metabacillus sp. KUDC1714]QNF28369.1 ABC transporter permease [Metabacillus sp. KUDC1714]
MQWWAIAKKDLRIMLKDPGAIVVLFMLPLMLMTIMSFALMPVFQGGEGEEITLPIVNLDQTNDSDKLIELLDATEGVKLTFAKEDGTEYTEGNAKQAVKDGEFPFALIIPEGFGSKIKNGEKLELVSYEDPAQANITSIIGRAIEGVAQAFEVEYIVSRMVDNQVADINQMVTDEIEQVELAYQDQIEALTTQLNQLTNNAAVPASVEVDSQEETAPDLTGMKEDLVNTASESLSNPSITIGTYSATEGEVIERPDAFQQNVPGYTVMYAFFIIMYAGRSFLNERNDGTFRRILAAPVDRWQLFMGKMIPNYLIGIVQVVVLFAFGHFVFDMSLGSSFTGLIVVTLSLVWASSCLGMLIAAVFKTDSQISGWSVLLALTLAALGGTMVPLFIMPDIMQNIALITPHAWALTGYQDILVRGLGFEHVLVNSIVLLGFGICFLLISLWKMNYVK